MSFKHELLIELLREVSRGMGKYVKEVLLEYDIPVTMMIIARHIGNQPGISISELSRKTGIAKSHVSNTIRELEQRGWVEKRADAADQRLLRLYLTDSATKHLEKVKMDIRGQVNALVSDIPEQVAVNLIEGLRDIKTALEQSREKKSNGQEINDD